MSLPDATLRPPRSARVAVSVAYGVQGLSLAILVTRIPTVRDRLGLSEIGLGLLLVLVPVMAGVGSVLAGVLTARVHSKPVLRIAGPLVPLSVVAVGLAAGEDIQQRERRIQPHLVQGHEEG